MNKLYLFHCFFWLIYYFYVTSNRSDSHGYYSRADKQTSWIEAYGTDTKFIEFVAYPFINTFNFNYEAMMALFSWFGYIGFVYFYIFFRENIKNKIKVWGADLLIILLFLPNMHFWTVSLGKGSLIFLGIAMFAYAMQSPNKRILALVFGSALVFNIRPHMFLFLGAGAVMGYFTGREKVPIYQKIFVYVAFIGAIAVFYQQILAVANINENEVLSSFESFADKRAYDLSRTAGSGVDMSNYPLVLKLFTFWFRPLFFDASGIFGIFISLENLLYILLTLKLFDRNFIIFLKDSPSLVKMSLTIFFTSSIALSFVMANLGIANRQKSMVMYFLFFVIISFLDYNKIRAIGAQKVRIQKPARQLIT